MEKTRNSGKPCEDWPAQNILIIPILFMTFGQILCTEEAEASLFRRFASHKITWCKTKTAFHKENIILTLKHGGGSVMLWGCFAGSGPGRLAIIDKTKNSVLYQKILKEDFWSSVTSEATTDSQLL